MTKISGASLNFAIAPKNFLLAPKDHLVWMFPRFSDRSSDGRSMEMKVRMEHWLIATDRNWYWQEKVRSSGRDLFQCHSSNTNLTEAGRESNPRPPHMSVIDLIHTQSFRSFLTEDTIHNCYNDVSVITAEANNYYLLWGLKETNKMWETKSFRKLSQGSYTVTTVLWTFNILLAM